MKSLWNRLTQHPGEGEKSLWYTAALWTLLLWMVLLVITAFAFPLRLYADPFVWGSLLVRVGLLFMGIRGLRRLFLNKDAEPRFYEFWKHYTGYAVVFTYVFTIFPQVVRDFNSPGRDAGGLGFVLLVLLTTLLPALHYLILSRDTARLALGVYTEGAIAERRALKKDKVKQKAQRKELKKQRNPLQNFWYEWLEPILGAILWVLLINHLFFQLYQIPSESMVPTFLTKDRVIALKSQYGPTVPLTNYRLPALTDPKTGQIVTFVSPDLENPDSNLRFKNVFTRVFQPFIYIITLTRVDIDSNEDGTPKARQLVKRVIGEPGDKICLLNDEVYKRTAGGDWTKMSEIPGHSEYGQANLFYQDNPRMEYQRINPPVRVLLDEAVSLVEDSSVSALSSSLAEEKTRFLSLIRRRGVEAVHHETELFLQRAQRGNEEFKSQLSYYIRYVSWINELELDGVEKGQLLSRYEELLGQYESAAFYSACRDLMDALDGEIASPGTLTDELSTSVLLPRDASPYQAFMIKANGLMKLSRLKFYNALLSLPAQSLADQWGSLWISSRESEEAGRLPGLSAFTVLAVYTDGLERPSLGNGTVTYHNYFEAMQFPEFPRGNEVYLGEGEYFLMGDNRYNSVDSRLGREDTIIFLDPSDEGLFSESVEVAWDGHVIPRQNIQGRVRAILFPFTRLRFF